MLLISIIKSKLTLLDQQPMIEWVMKTFRDFKKFDPAAALSLMLRQTHEYKWLNLYTIQESDFTFKLMDDIELYVCNDLFN